MARSEESVVDGSRASPKDLPSVDRLLREPAVAALLAEHGHTLVAGEARALLEGLRGQALAGTLPSSSVQAAALQAAPAGPSCARNSGSRSSASIRMRSAGGRRR